MGTPLVSILIPIFNGEPFLAECLESILSQDFGDYEVLISDDGSTDGSLALAERYAAKDPRIRFWKNPKNHGLTGNHNVCLREARGQFIKYLHQDDKFLHPSALARMLAVLQKHPDVSLVSVGSKLIDSRTQVLKVRNNFRRNGTWDGKDVIVKCLEANQNLIGEQSAVMFRRSQASRGFDPKYRQIVDLELWFHLLEQGRFAWLAEPLFAYRIHPQQATEAHHRTGVSKDEYLILCEDYYRKPWLKEHATRRMWFKQIHHLRKKYGERAQSLTTDARARLNFFWYTVFWLEHKLVRPFAKLQERILDGWRK